MTKYCFSYVGLRWYFWSKKKYPKWVTKTYKMTNDIKVVNSVVPVPPTPHPSHNRLRKYTLKTKKCKLRPRQSFSHTQKLFTHLNQNMFLMPKKKKKLRTRNYSVGQKRGEWCRDTKQNKKPTYAAECKSTVNSSVLGKYLMTCTTPIWWLS